MPGIMTKEQIDAAQRVEARQLLARIPAGPGYDDRVLLAVEQAMNLEWWRGYHAAQSSPLDGLTPEQYADRYVMRGEFRGITFRDDGEPNGTA